MNKKIVISAKLGAQIKEARRVAQLSQRDVADMLGVTVQCISSWERDRTAPNVDMLNRLAGALCCSVNDLTSQLSIGELSILQIEDLILNLDAKGLDRVIAFAQYQKTRMPQ